jgi:hypothetical protein
VAEEVLDPPLDEVVDRPKARRDRRRLDPTPLALELALHLDGQPLGFPFRAGPRGDAPPVPAGARRRR